MKCRLTLGHKYIVVLRIGMITMLCLLMMALICFIKADYPTDMYILGESLALWAQKIAVIAAIISFGGDTVDKILKAKKQQR